MAKIYTRAGDAGMTSNGTGGMELKNALRFVANGDIDELNSALGVAIAAGLSDRARPMVQAVQRALFDVGAVIAVAGADDARHRAFPNEYVIRLESWIDVIDADLPPLTAFILPGGSRTAAYLHLARTICRRAERDIVSLAQDVSIDGAVMAYLNRLSDFLFVAARYENRAAGGDVLFTPDSF